MMRAIPWRAISRHLRAKIENDLRAMCHDRALVERAGNG
jgi:hypothetical protein